MAGGDLGDWIKLSPIAYPPCLQYHYLLISILLNLGCILVRISLSSNLSSVGSGQNSKWTGYSFHKLIDGEHRIAVITFWNFLMTLNGEFVPLNFTLKQRSCRNVVIHGYTAWKQAKYRWISWLTKTLNLLFFWLKITTNLWLSI